MGIKWQEYVTNEEVLKRASLPSLECTLLQQQFRWAGHVARMEDSRMFKAVFFGELREGKRKCGAPKKRYKDQLKKQLSLTEIPLHSWQQEANSRENWRKVVGSASRRFECSKRDAAEGKRKKRKERMTSQSAVSTYTHICPRCGRACASRIGLYSRQRACRTPPTHWSSIARNQPSYLLLILRAIWRYAITPLNSVLFSHFRKESTKTIWNPKEKAWIHNKAKYILLTYAKN